MLQIMNAWKSFDTRRQAFTVFSIVALLVLLFMGGRIVSQPSMALLYSGLESDVSGDVIGLLEQRGTRYEVRGNAIFVPSGERDSLRMSLASEGVPSNSGDGYELLDGLSGFGTTAQMFDAAFWRAKEGELARTIVTSPHVTSARVHIAPAESRAFRRDERPSASVFVTTTSGGLPGKQARAIRLLVASAVSGLRAADVTVVGPTGVLLSDTDGTDSTPAEQDRAAALGAKIKRLLEARVGYGNVAVEVTVETDTEHRSIRETLFDPASRVAISTETEENTENDREAGGEVTVASNLPEGDTNGTRDTLSQRNELRERVNYEVSETHREINRAAGAIKRVSVAVLVNGITQTGVDGESIYLPRSDDELASLKDLVATAVGYDESRGDVVTLKSLQFETALPQGTEAFAGANGYLGLDLMALFQTLLLAIVVLVIAIFVVRPAFIGSRNNLAAPALSNVGAEVGDEASNLLTGEIADDSPDAVSGANEAGRGALVPAAASEDAVERLRTMISQRQDETIEILRSWLEDEEELAS